MRTRLAVIGGGASGLAAAIAAARAGAEVSLIERGHSLGRKVLAGGGGRCNLTNSRILQERYHGGRPARPWVSSRSWDCSPSKKRMAASSPAAAGRKPCSTCSRPNWNGFP